MDEKDIIIKLEDNCIVIEDSDIEENDEIKKYQKKYQNKSCHWCRKTKEKTFKTKQVTFIDCKLCRQTYCDECVGKLPRINPNDKGCLFCQKNCCCQRKCTCGTLCCRSARKIKSIQNKKLDRDLNNGSSELLNITVKPSNSKILDIIPKPTPKLVLKIIKQPTYINTTSTASKISLKINPKPKSSNTKSNVPKISLKTIPEPLNTLNDITKQVEIMSKITNYEDIFKNIEIISKIACNESTSLFDDSINYDQEIVKEPHKIINEIKDKDVYNRNQDCKRKYDNYGRHTDNFYFIDTSGNEYMGPPKKRQLIKVINIYI